MLRPPSVSGTRPSLATTNLGGPGSANNPRVISKKKEYYTVTALERNADTLRETFLAFAKQMKQAEEGAESIGHVLANWPHMFAIISSFAQTHEATTTALAEMADNQTAEDFPPTRLVRVEIDNMHGNK
ncbi:hypothetical protein BS47DRAFT_1380049 [Hydnum rufescens UP504]|uniref:DASH complex subunit DAD2 n=1 Tax=Hydnum rufescens UP504 TaxID=1448309 RepID=A0A9P6B5Y2_9AGAM|nr:hypothetical protein BS47DRAFT_1380049 [Hydnum rufescens UP504]